MAKYYDIDTPIRVNGDLTLTGTYSAIIGGTLTVSGLISGSSYTGDGTGLSGILLVDGSRKMTGSLTIDRVSSHLVFQESGVSKWHMESVSGSLKIVQTGIATQVTIASGGAVTLNSSLTGPTINATSNLQEAGTNLSSKYALQTTTITAGTGLTGGGDLTTGRTLSVVYGTTSGTAAEGNHTHSQYLGISGTATNSSKLGGFTASQFLRSDTSATMSAILTVPYLYQGNNFAVSTRSYTVSSTSTTALLDYQGVNLSVFRSYKVTAWGSSDRVAIAYIIGNGTSFTIKNSYKTGTSGTHINLYLDGSGIPTIALYGTSLATVHCKIEETGILTSPAYGIETMLSMDDSTAPTHLYFNGNELYHTGNLVINDSSYVKNNVVNQGVVGNFTISGNGQMYVGAGTAGTKGSIVVKSAAVNTVQIEGDATAKLTGVKSYINGSGVAQFDGAVTVGSLITNSTSLVTGFNSEMINSVKEPDLAKNTSVAENLGYGVLSGTNVVAQTVPNMTVLINSGIVYTNSGRRVSISSQSQSIVGASATYDRYDAIYIKGNEAGINEGTIGYVQGTPASTPTIPAIPATGVLLATVKVLKNIGSIQDTHITDARQWKNVYYDYGTSKLVAKSLITDTITSTSGLLNITGGVIKSQFATSQTISAGQTSVTWTHNANIGTNYSVILTSNSPNRHVYWQNKTTNSVSLCIDDANDVDIIVDAIIMAY